eukprot:COSAG01_NODE_2900_length_6892_cov_34.502871_11_plen_99_part_00
MVERLVVATTLQCLTPQGVQDRVPIGYPIVTCSPPGADVPVEWICRHRAQSNSSHIPPPQGHLSAAVAFGKGAVGGEILPARRSWRSISAAADCFSGT